MIISPYWDSSQFESTGTFKNYVTDRNNTDNVKKTYEKNKYFLIFTNEFNLH